MFYSSIRASGKKTITNVGVKYTLWKIEEPSGMAAIECSILYFNFI